MGTPEMGFGRCSRRRQKPRTTAAAACDSARASALAASRRAAAASASRLQGGLVKRRQAAVAHHEAAVDHHVAQGGAVLGQHQLLQRRAQGRVVAIAEVEKQQVRRPARRDPAHPLEAEQRGASSVAMRQASRPRSRHRPAPG
jgi:hypothetical protein